MAKKKTEKTKKSAPSRSEQSAANPEQTNKRRKPTLKAIAELSGLAVTTVSRALKDAPDLKDDTKKMVRQIARDIGYVPDRAGVGLRTGRTNVISLILSTDTMMMNVANLMSAMAHGLRGTPFHLNIMPCFQDQDPMEPVRYVVETGSADGIVFNRIQPNDPRVDYLLERSFPFATHGRTLNCDRHPYFDYDNESFGHITVRKLAERGCKNVLLLGPPTDQTYSRHMRQGAEDEARLQGINLTVESEATADSTNDQVIAAFAKRLRSDEPLDGFISASPLASMAVASLLEDYGRTLGEDIQIATKEPTSVIKLYNKKIIAVPENFERAGNFLAKAVLQAVLHPDQPPMQELEHPFDDFKPLVD